MEPPEDAVRVLRHACRLCTPGGLVLDLTSIPPAATVEQDGVTLGQLDQEVFLTRAAQTEDAVELLIREGLLAEEGALAHDVLKHFDSGRDLIDDVGARAVTRVPPDLLPTLERITEPLVERSSCLLRKLRVTGA